MYVVAQPEIVTYYVAKNILNDVHMLGASSIMRLHEPWTLIVVATEK